MPLKKSSDESDTNQRHIHMNSSVISIHNKRRHHQINSEEHLNSNYKHSFISKNKRDRFYNEEIEKQFHSNYKSLKVETYRETYKEESHYKNKRSRISEELIEKDMLRQIRGANKSRCIAVLTY